MRRHAPPHPLKKAAGSLDKRRAISVRKLMMLRGFVTHREPCQLLRRASWRVHQDRRRQQAWILEQGAATLDCRLSCVRLDPIQLSQGRGSQGRGGRPGRPPCLRQSDRCVQIAL